MASAPGFRDRIRNLDLQAKITATLFAVLVPTFSVVTLIENQLTRPILEEDAKQQGIAAGKALAAQILSLRLLSLPNPTPAVESALQEVLYGHPSIIRAEVWVREPAGGGLRRVATNLEDPLGVPAVAPEWVESVSSSYHSDEEGEPIWDIRVPIGNRRPVGVIQITVANVMYSRVAASLGKIRAVAAIVSVIVLLVALSYFLRKAFANERLLRRVESRNVALTEQLFETERELMNMEKLAVMGQLTASFAHEIGTPLNALGGHLQLLREESSPSESAAERFEIIHGQLEKIAIIVKGFLHSTSKPESQSQLVDVNRMAEKALSVVEPYAQSLDIDLIPELDPRLGPLRMVPVDLEQILLNLVNNSLDSIRAKRRVKADAKGQVAVKSELVQRESGASVRLSVRDTGEGIKKADIERVLQPFFTTKKPGEGTGLGLTICSQLARKYGGVLAIDSKEGQWTEVRVELPYASAT